jgi:uncharacterized coiled-coil DUF342 family protein
MSLQKREIAQQIVQLQEELSAIVSNIKKAHDNEDECGQDHINSLHLKVVVLEQEIDQLQKQFKRL